MTQNIQTRRAFESCLGRIEPFRFSPPPEQAKLEAGLDRARKSLPNDTGAAAWLEGWATPVDQAVEEILEQSGAWSS